MNTSSKLAPVLVSISATIVFIVLNGYAFGGSTQRLPGTSPSSDHANVLPQVYHQHDPALFSRDPQIQMGATFASVLWPIIGRICPPDAVPWAFFLLHVICLTAVFFLLWRLAIECEGGPVAGLLAMILFIVVRISPAAEPTYDTAFYTRGAALPLGLLAMLWSVRGLPVRAAAALVLACAIHAMTAVHMLWICLPLWLMCGRVAANRRIGAIGLVVAGLAIVAWALGSASGTLWRSPGEDWIAMQRAVNGSHLFVGLIPQSAWREFAVCGLFLLPALGRGKNDQLRRLALAGLIGAVASVILGMVGQLAELPILLQLSPLRGLKLTMVLALVSAAVLTSRSLHCLIGAGQTRSLRISGMAGGAALLALVCRQHYAAVAAFVLMMGLGDSARWVREVALVAAAAIGIWFFGVDAVHGWEQSTRTAWLIAGCLAIGVAIFAAWARCVGRVIDPPSRVEAVAGRFGVLLVSLATLGLIAIPAQRDDIWVYAARDYPWTQPWTQPSNPWAEAQRWVEKNTPVDSLFLVPPWLEGFRTYARRSEFVEYKMGTLSLFHPAFGQEWAGRMALLTPRRLSDDGYEDMAKNYNALTAGEIAAIVERYGITHAVVMASRMDLPYRTVYQNALIRVLKTSG